MSSTFFSDFLKITNFKTLLMVVTLIILFIVTNKLSKKFKFQKLMIITIFLGIGLGILIQVIGKFPNEPSKVVWMTEVNSWYSLFGNGFMDLLKMIVIPLILTSIIRVIMNMSEGNLNNLTLKTMGMFFVTTAIAGIVGIIIGNLFNLGISTNTISASQEIREIVSLSDTLRSLLPANPVEAMVNSNTVAVVIFATFIGLAVRRLKKKHLDIIMPFISFIEAFYKIIVSVSITIIKLMPYAVIPLMSNTIASRGISTLFDVVDFISALYLSVLVMFIIHLIILSLNKVNPIEYLRNVSKALILAFTSRSSLGTLPVTIESLTNKMKVDDGVASFVTSLGSNMGMNGCAGVYPALVTVMLANMSGIEMNFTFYVMLIIVITISSLGIAGIPGSATMSVSVVISGMGMASYFPMIGAIIAVDPIVDMARTMLNVNGTMITSIVVDKNNKKLKNKEVLVA